MNGPRPAMPCKSDPERWFPAPGQSALPAKRICRACPLRLRCLEAAVRLGASYGVWGGLNMSNSRARQLARAELRAASSTAAVAA